MSTGVMVEIDIYDAPALARDGCGCGCNHHHGPGADGGHPHPHGHGEEECVCATGPDPEDCLTGVNVELQAKALAMTLWKAFPGKVQVNYINVLQDPRGPALPQTRLLFSLAYPPPLVYLNGKGYFAGALPVERIREEVKKILDSRAS